MSRSPQGDPQTMAPDMNVSHAPRTNLKRHSARKPLWVPRTEEGALPLTCPFTSARKHTPHLLCLSGGIREAPAPLKKERFGCTGLRASTQPTSEKRTHSWVHFPNSRCFHFSFSKSCTNGLISRCLCTGRHSQKFI